ncbi:MAG: hypothetical protein JXL80_15785 [Planctomycetes bacterium]|nr:hypothetical protein [Planctomycetota bacterium]
MRHLMAAMVIVSVLAMVLGGCSSAREKPATTKAPASGGAQGGAESSGGEATTPAASGAVGKIKMGMTRDEVVARLGEPTQEMTMNIDGKEVLSCIWEKGDNMVSVQFHDGKAMVVQQGGDSPEGSAVDAGKVAANFSKVKMGMSEAEVEKLLGPPTNSGGTGAEGMTMVVKTWEVGDAAYVVSFMNGKVQMTHKDSGE